MPRSSRIRAVSFDVGGTLITPHPSVGEIYAATAARHGHRGIAPEVLEGRFRAAWAARPNVLDRRSDWRTLVEAVFHGLLPGPVGEPLFDAIYGEFTRAEAWRIYPDVMPALDKLAGLGLDLAIVSNWDERLRPLLRALRLDRHFGAIVVSSEAGFPKPSPVIFEAVLRQLGCPASAVLHVGDSLREDFAGATAAGFAALHLNRDAPPRDLQIGSLSGIGSWLSGV